jgi:hypothetical protein
MKAWERWERQVHEERLLGNHYLATQREKHWLQIKERMKSLEKKLLKGISSNWTYTKDSKPPPIELAWIIYSQIGWKAPHINPASDNSLEEEELWEDLPEIDPMEISLLCQEIEQNELDQSQETIDSLIDTDTLFCLRRVLNELSTHGIDIRNESFSKNWIRKKRRHRNTKGSGRMQEILAREQDAESKMKADAQKCGLLIKKTIDKKRPKGKKQVGKKGGGTKSPSRILASFFGLA